MESVDGQSTPVYEEKAFDETTVFISGNGSGSKRRRRKSLGRRVSFAEEPKLHIFPRDDEYETPTRRTPDDAAGSPSSNSKRRSPRLAKRVVDADKENRALDLNPGSHHRRRKRASKPLAGRGEESLALKPQNWLDERDSSAQAGNDEENTGPVDLRHLSFHTKESEMDEENLTLDSTTFALKFSLHRSKNGELAVVQSGQNSSAIVQAFPDDEEVLEKDMSFTINRKPLRKLSVSLSHEGVGEMTRDMSLTMQAPLAQRMASVNTSLDDNSVISSDQRIPATGKSSLPGSKDDNSALAVINSNHAENSPVSSDQRISATGKSSLPGSKVDNLAIVIYSNNAGNRPVPAALAVDVLVQIEERFGTGSVDDEINPSEGRAQLEARFGPGFVDDEIDHWVPATRNTALPSRRDDQSSASANSLDVENSPLPVLNSIDLRDQLEARFGTGFVGDQLHVTTGREENLEARSVDVSVPSLSPLSANHEEQPKAIGKPSLRHLIRDEEGEQMRISAFDETYKTKETLNPTEDAAMMLTEAEFAGIDTPPKDAHIRSIDMELKGPRETLNPTEEADFVGVDSPSKDVDVGSTDGNFSEWQRGREMVNPAEEAELKLTEADFTGIGIPPKDAHIRSTDMELKGAREQLNPTEEAEFAGVDLPPKYGDVGSTDRSFSELQRTREMVNSAEEAKMMLIKPGFTGIDVPPIDAHRKSADMEWKGPRKTLNPTEEAEVAGVDGLPIDGDVGLTDRSFSELQRGREMIDPAEDAALMLAEAEFAAADSPPEDVDLRSTVLSFSELHRTREVHSSRETRPLDKAEEAEFIFREAGFTGTDSPPLNVDVRLPDMGSTELQKAREMRGASETLNPMKEAELMLAEAEFTGTDSPPKNVDDRSPDMGSTELRRAKEVQKARKTLSPIEEAELMLTEAEFTGTHRPPKNVDVSSTDVGFTELQKVRETHRPAPETEMETGKYKVREPHHPEVELDSLQEMPGTGVTEIEIQKESETNKLQMDGDVTVKHLGYREREMHEIKDTPSSPEIGYIMTKDMLSRKMPEGEDFHSSDSASDAELCLKDESKETSRPLRDAHLEAAPLDQRMRASQGAQESRSQAQVTPGKRMPIVAFQQLEKVRIRDSPATANGTESPGPNSDNRAIKRTKFLRDMSSGDTNHFSPTLERVTAQVPRLSDLLAADMDSASSTPVRPMRRSMWMTPPASVAATRSNVLKVSNREGEDDNAYLTSPIDLSMEIVELTADPIRHSLHKSRNQAIEEAPKTFDGQVPERLLGTKAEDDPIFTTGKEKGIEPDTLARESMDPVHVRKTFQEKENTGLSQGVPLQFVKTPGKDSEKDRPALREIRDLNPAHTLGSSRGNDCELDTLDKKLAMDPPHIILRASHEENRHRTITSPRERAQESKTLDNNCILDTSGRRDSRTNIVSAPHHKDVKLDSLPNRRETVPLKVTQNLQRSLATKKAVDPTQILSIPQPKESDKGVLMNRKQGVESREKGDGHDDNPFVMEAVDLAIVTRTPTEEEQCTSSSPRPTGSSAQLIKAADLDKLFEINYFHKPESGSKLSDGKPDLIQEDRIQEGGGGSIIAAKMSVEEFLQLTKVQFSHGHQRARELLNDPSLDETHHVRSLSECFTFLCLVQPQLEVFEEACEALYGDVGNLATSIEELEERLTANNPAIFSYFQNANEWEKQRIRKQIERVQENYKLLAQRNLIRFRQGVEREFNKRFLDSKNTMTYYVRSVREELNEFADKCQRPFRLLQANLSSRDANQECTSAPAPKVFNSLSREDRRSVCLERIEVLKQERNDLKSSMEFKLAKSRARKQAAEDTLRGLKKDLQLKKKNLKDLHSQVVDKLCSGKNNLRREEVAHSPHLHVQRMRDEICLLHRLQDGFQLKSSGTENHDPVLELSYRSFLKRRYVVRKVGTAVKVLRSSWVSVPEKIEAMFPRVNALSVFSLATITTGDGGISKETAANSRALTQIFGPLSAFEAARFTLSSLDSGGIPEPTSLRASMQVTRILVGNLMELMEEVGKCQLLVNTSCGGGVLAEPLFRNAPDGKLQLELKFIDCVSSIKFFVNLDMSCLALNGYPLGDLTAKVEIAYCAPNARPRFKRESLEDLLSRVEPGYHRLVRIYSAVGAFLGSIRRGEQ